MNLQVATIGSSENPLTLQARQWCKVTTPSSDVQCSLACTRQGGGYYTFEGLKRAENNPCEWKFKFTLAGRAKLDFFQRSQLLLSVSIHIMGYKGKISQVHWIFNGNSITVQEATGPTNVPHRIPLQAPPEKRVRMEPSSAEKPVPPITNEDSDGRVTLPGDSDFELSDFMELSDAPKSPRNYEDYYLSRNNNATPPAFIDNAHVLMHIEKHNSAFKQKYQWQTMSNWFWYSVYTGCRTLFMYINFAGSGLLFKRNEYGELPLHVALRSKNPVKLGVMMVRMMGSEGLSSLDISGISPLTIANYNHINEVIREIIAVLGMDQYVSATTLNALFLMEYLVICYAVEMLCSPLLVLKRVGLSCGFYQSVDTEEADLEKLIKYYEDKVVEFDQLAIKRQYLDFVKRIVHGEQRLTSMAVPYGMQFMHRSATSVLKEPGFNPHTPDKGGVQPIHYAVYGRNLEMVRALCKLDASVNAVDFAGLRPMHYAVLSQVMLMTHLAFTPPVDSATMIRELWKLGGHVNAEDNTGAQPIHLAVRLDDMEVIRTLFELGAKVDATDFSGLQPIHYAATTGNVEVVKFLLDRGCSPIAKDNKGRQAIHYAASANSLDIVRLLVARHANIDTQDFEGVKPVYLTTQIEVMEELDQLESQFSGLSIDENNNNYALSLQKIVTKSEQKGITTFTPSELLIRSFSEDKEGKEEIKQPDPSPKLAGLPAKSAATKLPRTLVDPGVYRGIETDDDSDDEENDEEAADDREKEGDETTDRSNNESTEQSKEPLSLRSMVSDLEFALILEEFLEAIKKMSLGFSGADEEREFPELGEEAPSKIPAIPTASFPLNKEEKSWNPFRHNKSSNEEVSFSPLHIFAFLRSFKSPHPIQIAHNKTQCAVQYNIGASAKFDNEEYEESLRFLNLSIGFNETMYSVLNRGHANLNLSRYEEAISDFTRAMALDQMHYVQYTGHYDRALCYYALKKNDDALRDINTALLLEPNNADCIHRRATIYHSMQLYEEALQDCERTLDIEPKHAAALNCIGHIMKRRKRWQEAIDAYDESLIYKPANDNIIFSRGICFFSICKYESAIKDFDFAISLNPEHSLNARALSKHYLGDHEGALEDYKSMLDKKFDPVLQYSYGCVRAALGLYEAAIEDFDKSLAGDTEQPWAYFKRGYVKEALDRHKEAYEDFNLAVFYCDKLLSKEPNNDYNLVVKGNALRSLKCFEEASKVLRRAIEINTENALAHYALGFVYFESSQYLKALDEFNFALAIDPHHSYSYCGRARVHQVLEMITEAFDDFASAIHCDNWNARVYLYRGELQMALGQPELALADFNLAVTTHPMLTIARNARSLALAILGRVEEKVSKSQALKSSDVTMEDSNNSQQMQDELAPIKLEDLSADEL